MKTITLTCEVCGIQFERKPANTVNSKHHYCSYDCVSIAFSERFKSLPKEQGTKKANCIDCKKQIDINIWHSGKSIRCKECKRLNRNKMHKKKCLDCSGSFTAGKKAKYCTKCRKRRQRVSLANSPIRQAKRSQNETYFGKLCTDYFPTANITMNEKFFTVPNKPKKGKWDADVIIHDFKIAVLWNGAWHYKQISKKQSLKQVQNRDKLKVACIKANGYTPFIIKDMGKHDKKFVEKQFKRFLKWLEKAQLATGATIPAPPPYQSGALNH